MRLYIDGKEVNFSSEFAVNMSYKFLDTYNPSAIKTSYSKTISLPNTPENAAIFATMKVKHDFELYEDNGGRLLEKGYCTLDKIKYNGIVKTYDITLYGGLGDFFYNLKGDDDNPKTLASLWWGDITGKDQVREDLDPIMTWNPRYVYNTWVNFSQNPVWDTFRAVPCIYDDKILKRDLSVVPANGGLFPATTQDGSGSAFVGSDGSEALLVQAEENTCYAKQDFRSDLMPLGIKYRSIIETICKPENNGGYEVVLDPDFFKETNPYWTNMFLLKGLPTLDYDYNINSSTLNDFTCSLIRIGTWQGGNYTSKETTIYSQNGGTPWAKDGTGLALEEGITVVDNKVTFDIQTYLYLSESYLPALNNNRVRAEGPRQMFLKATNLDTNLSVVIASETFENFWADWVDPVPGSPYTRLCLFDRFQGIANVPLEWRRFKIDLVMSYPMASEGFAVIARGYRIPIKADWCGPSYSHTDSRLPDSHLDLKTDYTSNIASFGELNFTKQDLLGGTKTPFDYLVWFTKMFNLRFYLEPGTKRVSIMLPENLIQKFDPLDIQDRVCYDKEYSKTRKIIDEGFLKFNLTPNKNLTTEAYTELNGDTLFDGTYAVPLVEGKGQKEYLNSGLKVGSKARNTSAFAYRRTSPGWVYYGFNQLSPYTVSYVSGSGAEETRPTEDYSLNYQEGSQRYDFLTLDDDLADTIVLYSGLRATPWASATAIISRTSVDMVRCAGAPCWISGIRPRHPGTLSHFLGAEIVSVNEIPHYGIVPSVNNYDWGLTYSNVDFQSLIATDNIYNKYLKSFIEKVYDDPMVVECYVRLFNPDFRRLYWFDNSYWILVEVSNYNYKDEPVKCKFIRYRYDNA